MSEHAPSIRWGIIGTGAIATKFATGLQSAPGAELVAVGSRTQQSAEVFGHAFNIPRRHASYEALANDPDVDVVYIGTPHPWHRENALLCIEAGKAVLCEKPFAMNAGEAREMVEAARARGTFLMEAMWTRFRPAIREAHTLVRDGAIGDVELLSATIGWGATFDPQHRLFARELGGGILLDGGIYPISLASHFLGTPDRVAALAHMAPTEVDDHAAAVFGYPSGAIATVTFTCRVTPQSIATIVGTKGRIEIHEDWHKPEGFTLRVSGQEPVVREFPLEGNGYQYEAIHVMECLHAGRTESDIMPLDETLVLMGTLDTIREQWGLTYDADAAD